MVSNSSRLRRGALARNVSVSLAGLRAGGAFALDGALARLRGREAGAESELAIREARRFVQELGRLKGSYVKIGQVFALLGEHFLPRALTEALHELESATDPLPFSEIEPVLRESLGARLDELDVEPQAMAAASLAQVHRATIRETGERICLKVQYPELAAVIDADFDAVVRMLLLARWVKAGRDLDSWLASMREQLHREIDYRQEADMVDRVAQLVAAGQARFRRHGVTVAVPGRYPRYCTDEVLALEFIEGVAVTHPSVQRLSPGRRSGFGKAMLELFFCELYRWGILQTDPNFGNFLLCPRLGRDTLVLLDFGSIRPCEPEFLAHLGGAIAAGQREDRAGLIASLEGLGCLSADSTEFARDTFSDFCLQLLEPLREPVRLPREHLNGRGEYRWGHSRLMQRVGRQAARSAATRHFSPPTREFALIARKLTGVFTFIAVLDAAFNGYGLVQPYVEPDRARAS